jgi:hypothetical protein
MYAPCVDRYSANLAIVVIFLVGCGSDGLPDMVPIRGEVYYNGEPLADGFVVYLPKKVGEGRQATGPIQPDGSFVLTTQQGGDGAMHGAYDVVIYEDTAPAGEYSTREEYEAAMKRKRASKVPQKYSSQHTSGLSDTVDDNHSGFKRFEMVE